LRAQLLNAPEQCFHFAFAPAFIQYDVGPARLWGDESGMHGFDGVPELLPDGSRRPTAGALVPRQSPTEARSPGALDEHPELEEASQRLAMQQPQPVQQHYRPRFEPNASAFPRMRSEIVARNERGLSRQAPAQRALDQAPFDGRGMIEIETPPPGLRQVGTVPVKIIQRKTGGPPAKRGLKFFRQVTFPGAAAPCDCDKDWSH
jgi:hypothetical protein